VISFLQLLAQRLEIINFAVENDRLGLIGIKDRLLSAGKIDDRKAAHCHADALIHVKAVFIGTPMKNSLIHSFEDALIDRTRFLVN
jgi:aspartyl aminopeptidase